jgi:hypothetical protein
MANVARLCCDVGVVDPPRPPVSLPCRLSCECDFAHLLLLASFACALSFAVVSIAGRRTGFLARSSRRCNAAACTPLSARRLFASCALSFAFFASLSSFCACVSFFLPPSLCAVYSLQPLSPSFLAFATLVCRSFFDPTVACSLIFLFFVWKQQSSNARAGLDVESCELS